MNSLVHFLSLFPSEMPESFPKRRKGTVKDGDNEAEGDEEEEEGDEECENKEDEEENEEDEFQPSEGSENEMETDMLDYM